MVFVHWQYSNKIKIKKRKKRRNERWNNRSFLCSIYTALSTNDIHSFKYLNVCKIANTMKAKNTPFSFIRMKIIEINCWLSCLKSLKLYFVYLRLNSMVPLKENAKFCLIIPFSSVYGKLSTRKFAINRNKVLFRSFTGSSTPKADYHLKNILSSKFKSIMDWYFLYLWPFISEKKPWKMISIEFIFIFVLPMMTPTTTNGIFFDFFSFFIFFESSVKK